MSPALGVVRRTFSGWSPAAWTARVAEQVIREFDEAVARATGDLGQPGLSISRYRPDVLRTNVAPTLVLDDWMRPKLSRSYALIRPPSQKPSIPFGRRGTHL
jgi:hypothetical protein